jgi:hypothetical protein
MNKTQRKKAVAIAKDVLLQIKNLNVLQCIYLEIEGQNPTVECEGESLQKFLPELLKDKKCSVCALGACFLSHVNLFNNFDVSSELAQYGTEDTDGMFKLLTQSLGTKNMALIESAFELEDFVDGHLCEELGGYFPAGYIPREKKIPFALVLAAVAFGAKHKDSSRRLAAIMRNVIKNDGEFVVTPTKKQIKDAEVEISS